MQDQMPPQDNSQMPDHGPDREGAMAKADLYKLANYSLKLFKQIQDEDQLESWVQAKVTKAADYIASVYHYLEYEMKFSDYGDQLDNAEMYSEGQKFALKNKLMEAKEKVKELKKAQAKKADAKEDKKVSEGVLSGGDRPCTECGGTGMVYEAPKPIPAHVQSKVEKYKRLTKATHAAHKRLDANNNGIPDDEELGEETSSTGGEITRPKKGVTRHTHNPNRFTDEPHTEPKSQAKAQSAADKAGDKAADKAEEKEGKNWEKRFGKDSVTRVKDGKKVDEALKGGQKKLDTDNDDDIDAKDLATLRAKKKIKEGGMENQMHKDAERMSRKQFCEKYSAADGKFWDNVNSDMNEAAPRGQRSQDSVMKIHQIGKSKSPGANLKQSAEDALEKDNHKKIDQIHQYATTTTPTGRAKKVSEAKPSAGLSAAKKSATAKKAAAGKDIGKPGKSFDKVAKAAGGGEKGEKIAAAAMWKNAHESVEVVTPQLTESVELTRIKFLSGL